MTTRGMMVVMPDTAIQGSIRNCQSVEVLGYVQGEIVAQSLVIREGGRVFGKVRAETAEVHGTLQGSAFVKNLMKIGSSGVVSGNVQYGQLAMELGADLAADVRNIPPAIFGDLEMTVARGEAVQVTLADLTAVDPDDAAATLTYSVTRTSGGLIELASAPGKEATSFTQSDLEAGNVAFRQDGGGARLASFDVVVTDAAGATSGAPVTVQVLVR